MPIFLYLGKLFTVEIICVLLLFLKYFFPGFSHYLYSFLSCLYRMSIISPDPLYINLFYHLLGPSLAVLSWNVYCSAIISWLGFKCLNSAGLAVFWIPYLPFSWCFLHITQERCFYAEVTTTPIPVGQKFHCLLRIRVHPRLAVVRPTSPSFQDPGWQRETWLIMHWF